MAVERVLVAYGSKNGSTAQIADVIGLTLRKRGFEVDVAAAEVVADVREYDAVILGGAIYLDRWHRAARRFARKFAGDLVATPVWAFSSGPLDHSADDAVIPPVPSAAKAVDRLGARGHMTFGGCLEPGAKGAFGMARVMSRRAHGDFRNFKRIMAWADDIAVELSTPAIHLLAM